MKQRLVQPNKYSCLTQKRFTISAGEIPHMGK